MRSRYAAGFAMCTATVMTLQCLGQEGLPPAEMTGREGPRPRMGARGMGEGMEAGMGGRAAGMAGEGAIIARLLKAPKVAEELGLSQEQVKSLQEKLDALRKEVATLRIDLENASLEQARLLTGQTVDEAAVMAAVEKAGEISTKIAKLAAQQLLTVKKVLTPQQIEKAKAMMRERMEKERERFAGGRGQGEGGDVPKWRRSGERGAPEGKEDSRPRPPDRGERTPPAPERAL